MQKIFKTKKSKLCLCVGIVVLLLITSILLGIRVLNRSASSSNSDKQEEQYSEYEFAWQEYEAPGTLNNHTDIGVMITDCDSASSFERIGNGIYTKRVNEYVQGTGALNLVNLRYKNYTPWAKLKPVDISAYTSGSVHISLYINDPKYLGAKDFVIELTSSGTHDKDEIQWNITPSALKPGWNEIYLGMEYGVKKGNLDLKNINFFRVYANGAYMGMRAYLDAIYATNTPGIDVSAPKEYATTKDGYLFDLDTLKGLSSAGTMTLSEDKHKEGTAAVAIKNPKTVWLTANLITTDITAYKNGKLSFWLYIDDVATVRNGKVAVEISSSGTCDSQELSWTISGDKLKTGWNEIALSMGGARKTKDEINLSKVNYFRIYGLECSDKVSVILDGVRMLERSVRVASDGMILDCDTKDGCISVVGAVTQENGEYKQGSGALKTKNSTKVWWYASLEELVDVSSYANGGISMWIHVSDMSKLNNAIRFELTSGDTYDVDEYEWKVEGLKTGWNNIRLPFADASVKGNPNLKGINYMRMFGQTSGEVTIILDDIRAIADASEPVPEGTTVDSDVDGMIFSADSLKYTKISGKCAYEITRKEGEYVQGTGAFKGIGVKQILLEATLKQARDISAYKDGGLEFSLYIADKSKITASAVLLELKSASASETDSAEYEWRIPMTSLKTGWNTVALDFDDVAESKGTFDYTNIDYFRVFLSAKHENSDIVLILDNLHAVQIEPSNDTIDTDVAGMIFSADNKDYVNITSTCENEITRKEGEYVQGSGAFKGSGVKQILLEATLKQAMDTSSYKNGGVEFSLYIADKSKITASAVLLELKSASTSATDKAEYEWRIPLSDLTNGWNTVTLSFNNVASKSGIFDYSNVDYFRLFLSATQTNENIVLILDNLRAVQIDTVDTDVPGMIFSADNKDNVNITSSCTNEITRKEGEYMQGSGAFKGSGVTQILLTATLKQAKDISAYKDGGIRFSLYINDKSKITASAVLLEIKSSSASASASAEYEWRIPLASLTAGWNTVTLSYDNVASKSGTFDYSKVDYFRLFLSATQTNEDIVLILDNLHAVPAEQGMIVSCDNNVNIDGNVSSSGTFSITSLYGEYKEGLGAFKSLNPNLVWWAMKLNVVKDISAYQGGGIRFWLYINDPSYITATNLSIELGSGGTHDTNEMEWKLPVTSLKSGWQQIYLGFDKVNHNRAANLSKINWFRIYGSANNGLTVIVDDVRAVSQ